MVRFWLNSAEQRIDHPENTAAEHSSVLHSLQTKNCALEYKAEDAENHNRRNNLCIVGLAESVEGPHPVEFAKNLLRTLLPAAPFSPFCAMVRAHRISPILGPPGAPPRTFILKFLNFRERGEALRVARV